MEIGSVSIRNITIFRLYKPYNYSILIPTLSLIHNTVRYIYNKYIETTD